MLKPHPQAIHHKVEKADNRVVTGIRVTAEKLKSGELVICKGCDAALREFQLYCWDKKSGEDKVVKTHDHAMDEIRYFVATVVSPESGGFWAGVVERAR